MFCYTNKIFFFKIGITKIFCYNNKMFSSINKTFGCCSKTFGCSNKKKLFVVPNFVAVTKQFFPCVMRLNKLIQKQSFQSNSRFTMYFLCGAIAFELGDASCWVPVQRTSLKCVWIQCIFFRLIKRTSFSRAFMSKSAREFLLFLSSPRKKVPYAARTRCFNVSLKKIHSFLCLSLKPIKSRTHGAIHLS